MLCLSLDSPLLPATFLSRCSLPWLQSGITPFYHFFCHFIFMPVLHHSQIPPDASPPAVSTDPFFYTHSNIALTHSLKPLRIPSHTCVSDITNQPKLQSPQAHPHSHPTAQSVTLPILQAPLTLQPLSPKYKSPKDLDTEPSLDLALLRSPPPSTQNPKTKPNS